MAGANFAAASKRDVAKLRCFGGNQWPIAFALEGNVGASPTPSVSRAANKLGTPGAIAAPKEARLQMNVLILPIFLTPNLSRRTPTGNWHMA